MSRRCHHGSPRHGRLMGRDPHAPGLPGVPDRRVVPPGAESPRPPLAPAAAARALDSVAISRATPPTSTAEAAVRSEANDVRAESHGQPANGHAVPAPRMAQPFVRATQAPGRPSNGSSGNEPSGSPTAADPETL